ncbi:MAG: LLM class flavin-dependent oxidoreductase [Sphingorhabdus sp.]|jgi:alkanesulfonate monooxygenase SsuD/methylene tetrahydromethanopterin reductase-like flavin-dependent oxidoreductase (luciferase family)|uniref:LLM class flavin-dependent oxidoreductase n=1 Tax=Sphingorhabdus sp. TaxID=1902408 RepID=UPI00273D92D3|nr:LLM class flavin-dependent oxidoreductase [Sphingorhabdus sp.]MDP4928089.1 LLM class flavin-dependent oxidoreductase [Sphingorhabdus sp.]
MPKLTNACGEDRRWWGVMPILPAPVMGGIAKQMEAVGFEGCFSLQIYGPPFVPMAAVAAMTDTLKVSTGIAVAGTRSPVETAFAAMELDTISGGRFVLGLGTSLHSAVCGIYGEPKRKLLTHLREVVKVVRYVNANAHKGMEPIHGEYFNAEWTEMMLTAPPVREEIPIWIAALKDKLTSMALEIGDGLMVHALWTVDYTVAKKNFIEAELARFGRKRSDVEVNAWPWIAINDDKQQAINDSRATVAAYVGYKEYEAFFDAIGFGDEARACQLAGGEHGDVSSVIKNVSDEMVEAFVKCGPVDEVLEKIEPFWAVVDSLCPMTPYRDLTMEQLTMYNGGLYQMVAEAKRRQAAS